MTPISLAATLALSVAAVINPQFTPADLVRGSARIVLLKVSASKGKVAAAEVVETLKGAPLAQKSLTLGLAEDSEATEDDLSGAFGRKASVTALLVLSAGGKANEPVGAIEIDTQWFAVTHRQGKCWLDKDEQGLFAVWAGSARQLAAATRYVLAEPGARFPVRSEITWGRDAHLGKLAGKVNGCMALDLGGPIGPCVLVLCDAGDRVYRAAAKGGPPTDVTQELKLSTASGLAAACDFDGDGRLDLAVWDGRAIKLARQVADGRFGVATPAAELPECFSLDALGSGLLVGTPRGPVLLPSINGAVYAARAVPLLVGPGALRDLGPGGVCVVADFNSDGRCDVLQLCAKGVAFFAGEGQGRFKAPTKTLLSLPSAPSAAVCGDYDADGRLDVAVGGHDGLALLTHASDGRWENATYTTGELAYHGNANQPRVAGAAPCDINGDGRQGVALFYPDRNPMLFFNRGFACFGLARELVLSGLGGAPDAPLDPLEPEPPPKLKAAEALQRGQAAGTVMDLNGDGIDDLFAITPQGDVWALFGKAGDREALILTVALPSKAPGPVTLTVSRDRRRIGMHVLRPGIPATIGLQEPGPARLDWMGADGKPQWREVVVEHSARVELAPMP